MKQIFNKLFAIFFIICMFMFGNIVLADGAPDYNKNLYTVVVNNHNGAILYSEYYEDGKLYMREAKTVPYGTILIVQGERVYNGVTYLAAGVNYEMGFDNCISSADVEIYGEPVTPEDLRI